MFCRSPPQHRKPVTVPFPGERPCPPIETAVRRAAALSDFIGEAEDKMVGLITEAARVRDASRYADEGLDRQIASLDALATEFREAEQAAARTATAVVESNTATEQLTTTMRDVSRVVAAIAKVARQTRLLALNASVEAERAGDAGRGFAVVAAEVKMLADEASQSARDVEGLVETLQKQVAVSHEALAAARADVATVVAASQRVSAKAAGELESAKRLETAVGEAMRGVAMLNDAAAGISEGCSLDRRRAWLIWEAVHQAALDDGWSGLPRPKPLRQHAHRSPAAGLQSRPRRVVG